MIYEFENDTEKERLRMWMIEFESEIKIELRNELINEIEIENEKMEI